MTDGVPDGDRIEVLADRRTNRWMGLAGAALLAAVLGILVRSPGLVLVAGLGATLSGYARVATPPPVAVAVDRSFDPVDPAVGESVTVTLTVENRSDRTIADLRVADGVPEGVEVRSGDPRLATALGPGAATTVEYEVAGGRARQTFSPALVTVRDVAGLVERRARVAAGPDTVAWPTLRPASALDLSPLEFGPVGPLATAEGGEGLSFHSVREHRRGDPLRRIDWRRRARTGELVTVEFRRERVATAVLVVDARPAAAVAPAATARSAIDRSLTAASALVAGLDAAGHSVGLAALGPAESWIEPGRGAIHVERLQRRLAEQETFQPWRRPAGTDDPGLTDVDDDATTGSATGDTASTTPTSTEADGGDPALDRLLARIDADASVVLLSPLADGASDRLVRRLATHVRSVTVVSPDPTAAETPGQRVAALERDERVRALRARGLHVLDWAQGESLQQVLAGRPEGAVVAREGRQ